MKSISEIAILLTCYNRREKTLSCLNALFGSSLPVDYSFDVFLVDDGSTDGTSESVKKQFPQVIVIQGNGNLFWNKGMRLAWKTAAKKREFDFYIWLNDDTILFDFGLKELFECYFLGLEKNKIPSVIAGACCSSFDRDEFSYGGWSEKGPIIPNGELNACKYINGNATLIPKAIYKKIGNLSSEYTHAMGDFDYSLRTIQAGFHCYSTRKYVAICSKNKDNLTWANSKTPIRKRWELMRSPKGLNISEYNKFRRKFWGYKWIIYALKVYAKVLFPRVYSKISGK